MYDSVAANADGSASEAGPGFTQGMVAASPLDRSHLARYTLGDPALEREVLGLFVAQIPLTVESLKFAQSDKDWQMAAHSLKGSARAVGAWKLARLAQQAEKIDRTAGGASTGIVARIEEAAAEVDAYLASCAACGSD